MYNLDGVALRMDELHTVQGKQKNSFQPPKHIIIFLFLFLHIISFRRRLKSNRSLLKI